MTTLCTAADRRRLETLPASELEAHQLRRFNELVAAILPQNSFYAQKLAGVALPLASLDQLADIPFTYKEELNHALPRQEQVESLTFPLERYVRFHQTSGTRGRAMAVLDTAEDWQWWTHLWQFVLDAADVEPTDRVLMAFSFGPFIGFWSAHDAAVARGCLVIPAGGLSTLARLEMARSTHATVICCTPSYALHMVEVAAKHQIDVGSLGVKSIIVAGEPGGSIPAVRERIESAWQARVIDHAGASEVGPWGVADCERRGLHVIESEFIPEFLSIETGAPAGEGELSELVLTGLGRVGMPVIRYRTGDLVRPTWSHGEACRFVLLDGGIVGRRDDMIVVRGVNVFPTAVEQIVRSFPEVLEYRITAFTQAELDQLSIEIEDRLHQPARVADELRLRLGLRIDVHCVPAGTLPRFEGKGRRFVDQRA
jgi:phenylacetate-CoA ligase